MIVSLSLNSKHTLQTFLNVSVSMIALKGFPNIWQVRLLALTVNNLRQFNYLIKAVQNGLFNLQ